MSRPRAVVLVTGSELVRGDRRDLNGPFLAGELVRLGLEPARITIVGDGPDELRAAIREGLGADLLVISGGLGPTHDDRTIELLAAAAGRDLVVDPGLEAEIEGVSRRIAERLRRPYADFAAGVRKQASLPAGGASLGLAGTAPGVVLPVDGCVAVALPGPPPELQRLWRAALDSGPVRAVLARARPPGRRVLRFFGASESAVAQALDEAGGDGDGVEATICARDFEIHVDLFVQPGAEERADELAAALRAPLRGTCSPRTSGRIEEIVLALCRAQGLTLAAAESCTGGMVAERITSVPGASDVFAGSVVTYSNSWKQHLLGVSDGASGTPRRRLGGGRRRDGVRVPGCSSGRTSPLPSQASPARTEARPRSPSVSSTSTAQPPQESGLESSTCPANGSRSGAVRRSPRCIFCAHF